MSKQVELIVPKNHIALTSVNDIDTICQPLFQNTNIDFLWYGKYYQDGTVVVLSSDIDFQNHVLGDISDKIVNWKTFDSIIFNHPNILHNGTKQFSWLVENITLPHIFSSFVDNFGLRNGIEIVEKIGNCYEVFWFDSRSNISPLNFYLNNFDILEKFTLYFREQISTLLHHNENFKINIPNRDPNALAKMQQAAQEMNSNKISLANIHSSLQIKKYPFEHNSKTIQLSPKELACLQHLSYGYTQKEIGKACGISDRTVESHLEHIKAKLEVYAKKDLLDIFRNSRLARLKPVIDTGDKR
ncbi:MAG: hypothetical protein KAT71_01535 [Gammaproteobacteria bacterium]|nr:hypothetical protein [Gammaproteobacteria bacterium]